MLALKFTAVFLLLVCGVQGMFDYMDVATHKPVLTSHYKPKVIDNFLYEVKVHKVLEKFEYSEKMIQGNKAGGSPSESEYIEVYDVIYANKLEEDYVMKSEKDVKDRVRKGFARAMDMGIISRDHFKEIAPKVVAFVQNVLQHFSDYKFYVPVDEGYESPNCIFFLDVKNLKLYVFKDLVYKGEKY